VCARARFALVAITEDIFRLGGLLRNERPLHARVESRAAPAAQSRVLHLVDDRVRLHAERFFDSLVAVEFEIAVDVGGALTKALRNHLYLIAMGNKFGHG